MNALSKEEKDKLLSGKHLVPLGNEKSHPLGLFTETYTLCYAFLHQASHTKAAGAVKKAARKSDIPMIKEKLAVPASESLPIIIRGWKEAKDRIATLETTISKLQAGSSNGKVPAP